MPDDRSFRPSAAPKSEETLTRLPVTETQQPDPMLQITTGRMGAGGITIVAIVAALIVGVVLYGLNTRTAAEHTAAPPAATAAHQPAAGATPGAAAPGAPRANSSGVKG
jgi:hypothetical protein